MSISGFGLVSICGVAGEVSTGGVAGGLLVFGLQTYEDKYCENADVAAFNPLEIISYQVLLKYQVFISCFMILFKIVLLCLLPCHHSNKKRKDSLE